jgi:CBS domain-containing protein
MSARAAWRLEGLGFERVYRYTAGKVDWFAAGLAREGRLARVPRAGELARRDAPTCHPGERVGEVRARVEQAGWDRAVVVNDAGVVVGALSGRALEAAADTPLEEAMDPGPVTYRPDTLAKELVQHLHQGGARAALVTTAEGILVGVLRREEAEHVINAADGGG